MYQRINFICFQEIAIRLQQCKTHTIHLILRHTMGQWYITHVKVVLPWLVIEATPLV